MKTKLILIVFFILLVSALFTGFIGCDDPDGDGGGSSDDDDDDDNTTTHNKTIKVVNGSTPISLKASSFQAELFFYQNDSRCL